MVKNNILHFWFQSGSPVRGLLQKGGASHEIPETPAYPSRENVRVAITGTPGKANFERYEKICSNYSDAFCSFCLRSFDRLLREG